MGFESRATASYEHGDFSLATDSGGRGRGWGGGLILEISLKLEKILCKITTSPSLEFCLTSAVPNLDQQLPAVISSNNDIDSKWVISPVS